MSTTKYIAITLGPISRVINLAESTRELWGASYLFSYMAKKIIESCKEREFLLPLIKNDDTDLFKIDKKCNGAGIFPDRYIFESKDGDFDKLKEVIDDSITNLSKGISKNINETENEVKDFLKSYLKVYYFEKETSVTDEKEIVRSFENSMNLIEMQDSFPSKIEDGKNYLKKYLEKVNGTFLMKDAGIAKFESIPEISAADIISKGENIDAEKFLEEDSRVKAYHKYIAIVSADGDSMGKCIEKLENTKHLSQALLDFQTGKDKEKGAIDLINDYGGRTIYAGGDDLLFFAPICTKRKKEDGSLEVKTIYSLEKELNDRFKKCLEANFEGKENVDESEYPTLSFGVSITYHKYPMFEAKDLSDNLLKQSKGWSKSKIKNNLSVQFQKHSGQVFSTFLHKGCKKSYNQFNSLVEKYVSKSNEKKEENNFLSSVMHKLREMEPLFSIALQNGDEKMLKNIFDNYFNEKVHESYQGLFKDIQDLMIKAYGEYKPKFQDLKICLPDTIDSVEKLCIEMAYGALRFVQFVNKKKDE